MDDLKMISSAMPIWGLSTYPDIIKENKQGAESLGQLAPVDLVEDGRVVAMAGQVLGFEEQDCPELVESHRHQEDPHRHHATHLAHHIGD